MDFVGLVGWPAYIHDVPHIHPFSEDDQLDPWGCGWECPPPRASLCPHFLSRGTINALLVPMVERHSVRSTGILPDPGRSRSRSVVSFTQQGPCPRGVQRGTSSSTGFRQVHLLITLRTEWGYIFLLRWILLTKYIFVCLQIRSYFRLAVPYDYIYFNTNIFKHAAIKSGRHWPFSVPLEDRTSF